MKSDDENMQELSAGDRLRKWETLVDDRIRKVIGDGDMSGHPKAGKPIKLDEDAHIPAEERLAYKLMKDNDAVPPWVALAYTLQDKREKLIARSEQYAQDYVRRSRQAIREGSFVREQQIQKRWESSIQRLIEDINSYNRELLDYNLQIPRQITQMVPLDAKALIEKSLHQAQQSYDF